MAKTGNSKENPFGKGNHVITVTSKVTGKQVHFAKPTKRGADTLEKTLKSLPSYRNVKRSMKPPNKSGVKR